MELAAAGRFGVGVGGGGSGEARRQSSVGVGMEWLGPRVSGQIYLLYYLAHRTAG
jgi:hypothetical protein